MPMDTCILSASAAVNVQENMHDIKPKMTSNRRSSKPLMEKRRRARINDSLGQLKSLILEATNKDSSRHSKLEKADILEMTVRYLSNMHRHQITGSPNSSVDLNRYRLGYSECVNEVSRYLESSESGPQIRTQLIGHLANRCSPPSSPGPQQQQQAVAFVPAPSPTPIVAAAAMPPSSQHSVQVAQPSLPRGEIRVVLPPEALQNGQLPSHFIPVYAHPIPSPTSSTSSVDIPTSPLPSSQQTAYHQTQELSYVQGAAPTSPPIACTAPSMVARSPVSVQLHTEVSATEIMISSPNTQSLQQHHQVQYHESLPQPQFYYQDGAEQMKANDQHSQNYAPIPADENVWRPW